MDFGWVAQTKFKEKWSLIPVAWFLAGFVDHFLQSQVKASLKPEFIFPYCSVNATKTTLFPSLLSILISVTPWPQSNPLSELNLPELLEITEQLMTSK